MAALRLFFRTYCKKMQETSLEIAKKGCIPYPYLVELGHSEKRGALL